MNRLEEDLLIAYADGLIQRVPAYRERLDALFPEEMGALAPLTALTAQLAMLFPVHEPAAMPAIARAVLKERLLIEWERQMEDEHASGQRQRWQWAALGASFTVAGALAARAWWEHSGRAHHDAA